MPSIVHRVRVWGVIGAVRTVRKLTNLSNHFVELQVLETDHMHLHF